MKVIVSKKAVREYIREMLSPSASGCETTGDLSTSPVKVSSVVDPSASVTDPENPNFKPQNKAELLSSIPALFSDVSDDDASDLYSRIKITLDAPTEEDKMNTKKTDKKVEEAIRLAVRKMLREANAVDSYSGWQTGTPKGMIDCPDCEGEGHVKGSICASCDGEGTVAAPKKRGYEMAGEGEATYDEIAKEFGFAGPPGARQAIARILDKSKFILDMDPEEWDIFVLSTMNDYIRDLSADGTLTPEEVEDLKNNPEEVLELDTFRNYLDKAIKKSRRSGQEVLDVRK